VSLGIALANDHIFCRSRNDVRRQRQLHPL
jgi:hypothetical protein